jgi:hypothetical protein
MYQLYCMHKFRKMRRKTQSMEPLIVGSRAGLRYNAQIQVLNNMMPHARARASFRGIKLPKVPPPGSGTSSNETLGNRPIRYDLGSELELSPTSRITADSGPGRAPSAAP